METIWLEHMWGKNLFVVSRGSAHALVVSEYVHVFVGDEQTALEFFRQGCPYEMTGRINKGGGVDLLRLVREVIILARKRGLAKLVADPATPELEAKYRSISKKIGATESTDWDNSAIFTLALK